MTDRRAGFSDDALASADALRQVVRLRADVVMVDDVAEPGRLLDRRRL